MQPCGCSTSLAMWDVMYSQNNIRSKFWTELQARIQSQEQQDCELFSPTVSYAIRVYKAVSDLPWLTLGTGDTRHTCPACAVPALALQSLLRDCQWSEARRSPQRPRGVHGQGCPQDGHLAPVPSPGAA